jgi:hypothetical protein
VGALFLEFLGEELVVDTTESLTFGRAADLVVDDANPYLHRVLGCFAARDSVWFLQNLGRHIPLRVLDTSGASRIELGPADQVPIGFEEFVVRFEAGRHRYEISGALAEPTPLELGQQTATDTVEFGVVVLNDEQRLLVLALAEPLLQGHHNWSARLPSNKLVAARLGWKLSKYNRKLDYLCRRLAELGVDGLQGEAGRLASTRRVLLVEHMVNVGAVTAEELELLPPEPV